MHLKYGSTKCCITSTSTSMRHMYIVSYIAGLPDEGRTRNMLGGSLRCKPCLYFNEMVITIAGRCQVKAKKCILYRIVSHWIPPRIILFLLLNFILLLLIFMYVLALFGESEQHRVRSELSNDNKVYYQYLEENVQDRKEVNDNSEVMELSDISNPGQRFPLQPMRYHVTKCGCVRNFFNPAPHASLKSSCSVDATARGQNQRVVAFTFYGIVNDVRGYFKGIEGNAEDMGEFYPGWSMRVYHNISKEDEKIQKYFCELECKFPFLDFCNAEDIPSHGNLGNWSASAWRFLPMGDPLVSIFISRYLDRRFSDREVAAVSEWLELEKTWHVMRDHPSMVNVKIPAGMWGANVEVIRDFLSDLLEDILKMPSSYYYGLDEDILAEKIWPLIHGDSVRHDSYDCLQSRTSDVHPWPRRREDKPYNYVGVRQSAEPTPLRVICPPECRPKNHQDWLLC